MIKQLQQLYKTDSKGKIRTVLISVYYDRYEVSYGLLDGKMQTQTTYTKPKNIGKSNMTTASEQALIEAEAVWTKKCKANYSTDLTAPVSVNLPMKISTFAKHGKKLTYPCVATTKYNGVNALYTLVDGKLLLTSRGGEIYPPIPHLEDDILATMNLCNTTILAGELYIHGQHLQDITGAVKKPKELSKQLTFVVFDLPEFGNKDYTSRLDIMRNIVDTDNAQIAPFTVIYNTAALEQLMVETVENGYEGIVIHNMNSKYVFNTRSSTDMKLKPVLDDEFEIADYSIDKLGHPIFKCKISKSLFSVKIKGNNEHRLKIAAKADSYVGKWLTIEYEMLSKDGVPLKPVGISIRDCDSNGNPLT